MFENAVDGMLLADVETHRFVNANNKLCKMIGYSLDEIKNLGIEDIHPKEDLSYVFDKFEKQIKGETTLAENLPVLRKDGSIFYADINGSIISLKGKTYLLGAFRDITGRREMEEKLRESEARYRTIFENSGSPMALVKNDLSILMMNDEFAKLSGYSQEDLKSKDVLQFIHTEDLEKVKEYHRLRNIDPSSVPDRYELRMVDKDGQTKEGYIMVAAVPDTDIMVIAFADVTEIKRSEQKLKEQKDLLDNINKALEHKVKEIQEAMGHIKRLEGLVPICASCKKIKVEEKDAEGKDKWVQLETYISQKTDASLTHGLCPDCIKKLYGNKLGKEKRDSDA